MSQLMRLSLALAACAPVAAASDLNLSIESGGSNTVTVPPCSTVNYSVVGELSDNLNEGLALFVFNLAFNGGDLTPANAPNSAPMLNFATPLGINNPQGFGGVVMNGNLHQIGGGQNTINNTFAAAPSGAVLTGVAQPGSPEVLATGSLTSPDKPGTYTLAVFNVAANVIRQGESGFPFWAVDKADPGTLTFLTIVVEALSGSPASLSVAGGGVHTLSLDAGSCNASRFYLVLGSFAGTSPGFPIPIAPSCTLPLNFDGYFNLTLTQPNNPPLGNTFGQLDLSGQATATLTLPAGAAPQLAGLTANHAFALLDPLFDFASNAVPVTFVP